MTKKIVNSTSKSGSQSASPSIQTSSAAKSTKATNSNNTHLGKEEKAALDRCLATITKGLSSYVEIGAAFKEIKEKKLHRAESLSFEEYCVKLLGISKAHVNRSIQASDCAKHIEQQAPNGAYAMPRNEGSARVIAGLSPDEQLKVAELVKKTVGDSVPTAEDFKTAKDQVRPPKAKAPATAKKVVLRENETMSIANLSIIVDDAKDLVVEDKPKEDVLRSLDEAMEIIQHFLRQLTTEDEELPAKDNTTH